MKLYKQLGGNEKYPKQIQIWRLGEQIPEWLSDSAKVKFIDGEGNKTLAINNLENGYEIIDSSGNFVLVKTKTNDSLVCFGENKIFSLTKKQFDLLYENNL